MEKNKIDSKICPICKKSFTKKDIGVYGKEFNTRIFCSQKCMGVGRRADKNPNWVNGSGSIQFGYLRKKIIEEHGECNVCGNNDFIIRHLDGNRRNNNIKNLKVECIHCFEIKIHKRYPYKKGIRQCRISFGLKGFQKGNKTKSQFKKGHKGITGEKHSNWRGGLSFQLYGREFNFKLKEKVRERDNHICQICGKRREEQYRRLDVHHIDYNKKNNTMINLIALCHSCHVGTNNNRDRWWNYFLIKYIEIANT